MKEYKQPIRISHDDPLCSASALNGTVIGILFDKKGSEIKTAIGVRLGLIDKKIVEYDGIITKISSFIEKKRVILKELDDFVQSRSDEKKAKIRPYQRNVEDILKKCEDEIFDYDKSTYKMLGKKALTFEDGFDDFKTTFVEFDEFLKREKDRFEDLNRNNYQGLTGIQGMTGCQGLQGSTGATGRTGEAEKILSENMSFCFTTTEEDKAVAKMRTLRDQLQKYVGRIESLKLWSKKLDDERRQLKLIMNHINDDRDYKLDMNKLLAFGFEDIEVQ